MELRELPLTGAYHCVPKVHKDDRGGFLEYFKQDALSALIGHSFELAQANCSYSQAGVLRGVHFADVPPGQAKYVTCAHGAILDVVVDIRVGSPTFGQHAAVMLTSQNREALYISEGLGHAFMALSDDATVLYMCSTGYHPDREHGINPLDPQLNIAWPTQSTAGAPLQPLLSAKDEAAPSLHDAQQAGLLPDYTDTMNYVASLKSTT